VSHFQDSPIEVSEVSCSRRQEVTGVIPGNMVRRALREIEDGPVRCGSESKLIISVERLQRFHALRVYKRVVTGVYHRCYQE
jgi:hypothetical protein